MAFNPFIGWSKVSLQEALLTAQEEMAAGATLMSTGVGDVSGSSVVSIDLERRIELLYRALYLLDPVAYPIDQISRITRTKPAFV